MDKKGLIMPVCVGLAGSRSLLSGGTCLHSPPPSRPVQPAFTALLQRRAGAARQGRHWEGTAGSLSSALSPAQRRRLSPQRVDTQPDHGGGGERGRRKKERCTPAHSSAHEGLRGRRRGAAAAPGTNGSGGGGADGRRKRRAAGPHAEPSASSRRIPRKVTCAGRR